MAPLSGEYDLSTVYASLVPENAGIRPAEIAGKSLVEIAEVLVTRLIRIAQQTGTVEQRSWAENFVAAVTAKESQLREEWEMAWISKCNGKKLIQDLYREHQINMDMLTLKKRIIKQMRTDKSPGWRLIESRIREALV